MGCSFCATVVFVEAFRFVSRTWIDIILIIFKYCCRLFGIDFVLSRQVVHGVQLVRYEYVLLAAMFIRRSRAESECHCWLSDVVSTSLTFTGR